MQHYSLHKTQSIVASDRHRFRVVCCGRRWGKSTLAVLEMVGKAVAKSDTRVAYIANTYAQARDISWELLKDICRPVIHKINESRLEISVYTLDGGTSTITLKGWESVEMLRGMKFHLLVLDEVSTMRNFWLHWQEVLRPTLTDYKGEALFISTPKGFNHFFDLHNLQEEDSDFKSFHFSTYDNPHIPVDEIDKAKKELTEDRFAQEYLADFRKTEGLVYKEFNRERHTFDEPGFEGNDFVVSKTFGGADFGTTNPASAIEVKKDNDGNYWVYERIYKTGLTDSAFADHVAALRWHECYPDPESASGCEELRRRGVNVREVIKNKDSVRNGINAVRELFKAGRLYIHKGSKNLIWELETYSYPEKKPDHNEQENPIKENDHALDALRYALSMEPHSVVSTMRVYKPKYSGFNRR